MPRGEGFVQTLVRFSFICITFHVAWRLGDQYCRQGELRQHCLAARAAPGGVGVVSIAWLRHNPSELVPGQLKQAGVHGIGISIKAEVNSVIPGHCSEKKLHFLKAEL